MVEIDNGGVLNPEFDYVTIELDRHGQGSAKWVVPESGWNQANFNAPECPVLSRLVGGVRDPRPLPSPKPKPPSDQPKDGASS